MRHIVSTRNILTGTAIAVLSLLVFTSSAMAAHGPLTGEIEVTNDRFRPVTVWLDGQSVATLAPQARKVLRSVPNGVRVLEFAGPRGRAQVERVTVRINKRVSYRVAPVRGQALIKNKSGVDVRLVLDGQDLGRLNTGANVSTGPMRPGTYELVAKPMGEFRGAPPMRRTIRISQGETQKVRLKHYLARVSVTNTARGPARLFVNGAPAGRVQPGASLSIADLAPGKVELSLRRRGDVLASTSMRLAPGGTAAWTPAIVRVGSLDVTNRSRRTVTVTVGGQRIGALMPGQSRVVSDLRPGSIRVIATTPGGRRVVTEERVVAGRVAAVDVNMRGAGIDSHRVRPVSHTF
ncbi:MAG: hypothetical protein ACI9MR_000210 [Myxococcota bacterium]|jgi:hypothetical protein